MRMTKEMRVMKMKVMKKTMASHLQVVRRMIVTIAGETQMTVCSAVLNSAIEETRENAILKRITMMSTAQKRMKMRKTRKMKMRKTRKMKMKRTTKRKREMKETKETRETMKTMKTRVTKEMRVMKETTKKISIQILTPQTQLVHV